MTESFLYNWLNFIEKLVKYTNWCLSRKPIYKDLPDEFVHSYIKSVKNNNKHMDIIFLVAEPTHTTVILFFPT